MGLEYKWCKRCVRHKSFASFGSNKRNPDGKQAWCRACVNAYSRGMRKADRKSDDVSRVCTWCGIGIGGAPANAKYCSIGCSSKARYIAAYGLTVAEYFKILEATNGRCPICKKKPKRWCMDHNHETGETYGLVCQVCNVYLLGWSYHSDEVASNLVEFLRNPPVRKMYGERFVRGTIKGAERRNKEARKRAGPIKWHR